jgi:hypothetical protein
MGWLQFSQTTHQYSFVLALSTPHLTRAAMKNWQAAQSQHEIFRSID